MSRPEDDFVSGTDAARRALKFYLADPPSSVPTDAALDTRGSE